MIPSIYISFFKYEYFQQAMEAKLLADGEKAFQAFDKNINEAIKQNEAVEKEIKTDIDEQSEHRIQEA